MDLTARTVHKRELIRLIQRVFAKNAPTIAKFVSLSSLAKHVASVFNLLALFVKKFVGMERRAAYRLTAMMEIVEMEMDARQTASLKSALAVLGVLPVLQTDALESITN